jgi:hypothetical protein
MIVPRAKVGQCRVNPPAVPFVSSSRWGPQSFGAHGVAVTASGGAGTSRGTSPVPARRSGCRRVRAVSSHPDPDRA